MTDFGEITLLVAFVAVGFATFSYLLGDRARNAHLLCGGLVAAVAGFVALTGAVVVLAVALIAKDFSFDYVVKYSSRLLAWQYSLSALWVGQAGSLLLWAWITLLFSFVFRFARKTPATRLENVAFGLTMGYVVFLLAVMLFGADPMKASAVPVRDGEGLSPLLQHPAMIVHPPIVFTGYAAWTIPCALAIAALITGQFDLAWVRAARPWAVLAWAVLGGGILLGADWAYEELGWGGYWGWDPVENGSLIPWLTGTVLIHSLMVWRHRGGLKKTALTLAIATFGLCNFATFLTRSGIFSSVHAFSQSPIGWMFLGLLVALAAAGAGLIRWRRHALASQLKLPSFLARETQVLVASAAVLLLAAVVLVGTALLPISALVAGAPAVVGPGFYNAVLVPTGLLLLSTTVAVPLLRWGGPPRPAQRWLLWLTLGVGAAAAVVGVSLGVRRPEALLVTMVSAAAPVALVGATVLDARRRAPHRLALGLARTFAVKRRSYAGYLIHLGFIALAVGVTGSSLGSRRHEAVMTEGDRLDWGGFQIRYRGLLQTALPDRLVAEADLEVSDRGEQAYRLRPARHFHLLQQQWTTEVDIHSNWSGDFYAILNNGEGPTAVSLTFIDNPLIRWMWLGGGVSAAGALITLWPARRKRKTKQRVLDRVQHVQPPRLPLPRRAAA